MPEQLETRAVDVDDLTVLVREDHRVAGIPERRLEEGGPAVRGHATIVTLRRTRARARGAFPRRHRAPPPRPAAPSRAADRGRAAARTPPDAPVGRGCP